MKSSCPSFSAALFAVWIVCTSAATAETVTVGRLPVKPGKAGFVMDIELEPVGGNGYQPTHLKFAPLGKTFTHDRHLQIVIEPQHYGQTALDFAFRQSMTLPEGMGATSTVVYLPHYYPWEKLEVWLYEDGRPVETGHMEFHLGNNLRPRFAKQQVSVGIVLAADAAAQNAAWKTCPDVRTLVTVLGEGPLPEDTDVDRLEHKEAKKLIESVQPAWVQFRPIDESALHDHWFAYSQLDVIIVASPVWARMESEQPEKLEHLKHWLAAGGNLWIYATGAEPKSELAGNLAVQPVKSTTMLTPNQSRKWLDLNANNDTTELIYEAWNGVQKGSNHYSFSSSTQLETRNDVYKKLKNKKHPFAAEVPVANLGKQIHFAYYGLGKVVTIAAEDPFPGSFQFWQSLVNHQETGRLNWTERMGIDVPVGNDNYWMWLIPSVGQPPVKSFVLLNTLFAILVGPVCYFLLRRRERLYLLYFAAPTMALIVTISLFAYALAADGTKTKVRSRQLTWIDAANECVVQQSRQTYYAVLGRRGGIQFPKDAAIYPVRNTPAFNRYYQRHGRSARLGDYLSLQNSQHLSGRFLPPRDQVQYLVTHPQSSQEKVEFDWNEKTVSHNLSFSIVRLVVCDAAGKYWEASKLAPGSKAPLLESDSKVIADLLNKDVLPPLESVPMLQGNMRRYGGVAAGVEVSMLEGKLEKWAKQLPKNTFVGLAETVDEQSGVEGALVLDSVHVVLGEVP